MAYMKSGYGVGEYDQLATPWAWMYYPPPYDFADPLGVTPPPTFIASAESMDMGPAHRLSRVAPMQLPRPVGMSGGDCGCGGKCGGCGDGHAHGMGLFDSGFDISGWGLPEWAIVAAGAYVLYSVAFTSKRAVSSVRSASRKRASRARRKAQLEQALSQF